MSFVPGQRPWSQLNSNWQGIFNVVGELPNVLGSSLQMGVPNVQLGDLAYVTTGVPGLYVCTSPTQGAAVWVLLSGGGGGTGGAGYDFVFDPLGVQNPAINLYSVWADLITAINPASLPEGAPPVVTFRNNFTVPLAGMPLTGWPMNFAELRSYTPATGTVTLTIPDGAKLDMLSRIFDSLVVTAAPTTDGVFEWTLFPPGTVPERAEPP